MVSLNRGYHEHLRAAGDAVAASVPRQGDRVVLDLGCGSGASTAALVAALDTPPGTVEGTQVLGLDLSSGMIAEARRKSWPAGVDFVHAPAEDLPAQLAQAGLEQVDGVLACYLFRNLPDPDRTLADVYRALVPGGCLVVQEYSVAGSRAKAALWTVLCWLVIIPLSAVLTRSTRLYRYLWRSVLRFDSVPRFRRRLTDAGFAPVTVHPVNGWQRGILHTVIAYKPVAT